jgi:uncharacterized FlaG/YvyC family protein
MAVNPLQDGGAVAQQFVNAHQQVMSGRDGVATLQEQSRLSGAQRVARFNHDFAPTQRESLKVERVDLATVGKTQPQDPQHMASSVRDVIPKLNSVMHTLKKAIRFEEFAESGRFFVRAVDLLEGKEVSRVPLEAFLRHAQVTERFVNGLFLNRAT